MFEKGSSWAKQLNIFKSSLDLGALPLLCPFGIHTCLISVLCITSMFLWFRNICLACGGSLSEWSSKLRSDFLLHLSSSFLCFLFLHVSCSESLQPDCEMMSQIHKTLTSSFQLYLLFSIHISFSFERTCTRVCKPTRVGVSFMVCVALVVTAVHCLCMKW